MQKDKVIALIVALCIACGFGFGLEYFSEYFNINSHETNTVKHNANDSHIKNVTSHQNKEIVYHTVLVAKNNISIGDVLISNSINIDHYIKSGQMNNKLNKRFSDFKDFTSYAESMVDFIYEDYDLWTSYEIPDIIVKRLSKWENNKYIKVIVELFKKYSLQYE